MEVDEFLQVEKVAYTVDRYVTLWSCIVAENTRRCDTLHTEGCSKFVFVLYAYTVNRKKER